MPRGPFRPWAVPISNQRRTSLPVLSNTRKPSGGALGCLRLISGNRAWQELHDLVQVLEGTVLDLNWLNFVPMNNPFNTKHCLLSSPHFAREALRRRLLLPIWAHVGAGRVLGLHEWPPLPPRSRPIVDFADGHPVVRGYVK